LLLIDLWLDIHGTSLTVMIVGAHRLEMIVRLVSALDAIVPMVVLNRLDKRVVGTKLSHTSFCVGSIAVRNLISRGKGCI